MKLQCFELPFWTVYLFCKDISKYSLSCLFNENSKELMLKSSVTKLACFIKCSKTCLL